jgi:hypothetical protein
MAKGFTSESAFVNPERFGPTALRADRRPSAGAAGEPKYLAPLQRLGKVF